MTQASTPKLNLPDSLRQSYSQSKLVEFWDERWPGYGLTMVGGFYLLMGIGWLGSFELLQALFWLLVGAFLLTVSLRYLRLRREGHKDQALANMAIVAAPIYLMFQISLALTLVVVGLIQVTQSGSNVNYLGMFFEALIYIVTALVISSWLAKIGVLVSQG